MNPVDQWLIACMDQARAHRKKMTENIPTEGLLAVSMAFSSRAWNPDLPAEGIEKRCLDVAIEMMGAGCE